MPLTHLLSLGQKLLYCWHAMVQRVPALLQVVAPTLLPLVQQLQGCSSLLTGSAASRAPAASVQTGSSSSSSSSSSERQLPWALFDMQKAASMLLTAIAAATRRQQLDAGVAAEVLRLQNDPAVVEMQLQLLTAWTAQLHKQHTAHQQLPPGAAVASSSSSSSSTQQQQQQPAKQQHRADLLPIPAFHQDMLQLLPGGQAYLDAAAEEAAGWGLTGEGCAARLRTYAGGCCHTISHYLHRHLYSITGQQQISRNAQVVSGAAVRLVLELQLLASGAVQRQQEQHRQQQQQQASTLKDQGSTYHFALQTWDMLGLQIDALAAISRSCLPPEVLQQAGLQLLQALAAPLQQWQLSRTWDCFLHDAAVAGALPRSAGALTLLMTAACGAEPIDSQAPIGEQITCTAVFTFPTAAASVKFDWPLAPLRCERRRCYRHDQRLHMYTEVLIMRAASVVTISIHCCCVFPACRAATWPADQPSSSTPRGLHSPYRLLHAHAFAASSFHAGAGSAAAVHVTCTVGNTDSTEQHGSSCGPSVCSDQPGQADSAAYQSSCRHAITASSCRCRHAITAGSCSCRG
jgi:hypothetical protein